MTRQDTQSAIRLLEKTLEFSSSCILFTDPKGKITYANRAFLEKTGYCMKEVFGQTPNILKSGRQSPEIYQDLWKTIRAGQTWIGRFENRRKDGTLFWETATIFPILDEQREITQYVAIKEDITEEKRGEEILEAVANANRLLLESDQPEHTINEILTLFGEVCDVDRAYLFSYHEPDSRPEESFLRLDAEWNSGRFEAQIDNLDLQRLPAGTGLFREWMDRLKESETISVNTAEIVAAERAIVEQQKILSLLLVPVHSGGKYYGLVGFDDCRSERCWGQREISLLHSIASSIGITLQKKKLQKDLEEALLRAESSAAEANRANSAKGTFLATMSHEIRTPLNGILGVAQVMLDEETCPSKRDWLETIYKSGANLNALLTDVLDLSKIEAGKLEIFHHEFSARALAAEVKHLFTPTAKEKGIDFILEIADAVPEEVYGDSARIRQVIINLVSNALKFTAKGHVKMAMSYTRNHRNILQISVEDTGDGIRPEVREKLFEMFTQGDSSTTRRFGGTGLGLAICRSLVEAMDGKIWFESAPQQGSRFFVELPCDLPDGDPSNLNDSSCGKEIPAEPLSCDTRKPSILVVEDNPMNQRVTQLQLSSLGYSCDIVDDGEGAIRSFQDNQHYELVFMDCQMPGIDGFEATRQILENASPPPYIIALSASASSIDQDRAKEAGMREYLIKPVSKAELQAAFERFHNQRDQA